MDATSDTAQVEETASRILWPALELVWDEKSNRGDKNSTITVWVWVMICKIDDSSLKLDLAQATDKWWNVSLNFRTANGKRTELKFPGQISAKYSGWMFIWMLWANPISCGRIIGDRWWMVCSKRHCVARIIESTSSSDKPAHLKWKTNGQFFASQTMRSPGSPWLKFRLWQINEVCWAHRKYDNKFHDHHGHQWWDESPTLLENHKLLVDRLCTFGCPCSYFFEKLKNLIEAAISCIRHRCKKLWLGRSISGARPPSQPVGAERKKRNHVDLDSWNLVWPSSRLCADSTCELALGWRSHGARRTKYLIQEHSLPSLKATKQATDYPSPPQSRVHRHYQQYAAWNCVWAMHKSSAAAVPLALESGPVYSESTHFLITSYIKT